MTLRRGSAVAIAALVLITAGLGLAYGQWAGALTGGGSLASGYINADFTSAETNDPPGTIDPGYDKDVATCTAELVDGWCGCSKASKVRVVLDNAYPSYTCTLTTTIASYGCIPERLGLVEIDSPPEVTVQELTDLTGTALDPHEDTEGIFTAHVEQSALQGATYTFDIHMPTTVWVFGTPGFWMKWDWHDTFTKSKIEGWLVEIDATSDWLGPTTTRGMEDYLKPADHWWPWVSMVRRFQAHYLATQLNLHSGILNPTRNHDITGQDPGNYLGLVDQTAATLPEIIDAIEAKAGAWPSRDQAEIMKDVCDALNSRRS